MAKSCKSPRRCLICEDRGDKEVAHVSGSGSCPVFREELRINSKSPESAAPVWDNALQNNAIQKRLFSAQRLVALRIVSAYRTISTSTVLLLASVPPIDLLAEERQETFQLRKELTCADLQEIARAKEAIRKDGRRRLVEKWQMRWHGEQKGR